MPASFRFVNFSPVVPLEIIQSVPDYGIIPRIIVNEPNPFFRTRVELAIEPSSNAKFWTFVERVWNIVGGSSRVQIVCVGSYEIRNGQTIQVVVQKNAISGIVRQISRSKRHTTAFEKRSFHVRCDVSAIPFEVVTHFSVIPFGHLAINLSESMIPAFTNLPCSKYTPTLVTLHNFPRNSDRKSVV